MNAFFQYLLISEYFNKSNQEEEEEKNVIN
jgi:hypothetical protein